MSYLLVKLCFHEWIMTAGLLVHLLPILAVASMSFICGCTLSVILFAAHYLYMHDERLADKELQNMKIYLFYFAAMYKTIRVCFCCNVFAMYFMRCICSTPK
ncbi:hypothetical protein BDA96_02G108800 [Sorghum bicolor]|uniref:Uncharacterized protein n=2 Tax=Sorghum bicolor TaxID=4558 RepID=A0A921RLQ7_SORBI|nr:hypothetical protein BDA96_02G108800 [Sorghum bicolor]KXG34883.1 hypothetical protein SORBI_3002G103700 [Sorghum bicolor]